MNPTARTYLTLALCAVFMLWALAATVLLAEPPVSWLGM
jgi:hypothetical protein